MAEILTLLQEQEGLCEQINDTPGRASALGGQGRVFMAQGKLEAALDRFEAQARALEGSTDPEALSRCEANKTEVIRRMEGYTMEAQVFAKEAIKEKMSAVIRFPEIPVYINAIYRAYGPPGPETMHLMTIVPERLAFRCSECGVLDADSLMREYSPSRYSMEDIAQKTRCPFCGRSETVVISYDPNIGGPSSTASTPGRTTSSVAPKAKRPWWKIR